MSAIAHRNPFAELMAASPEEAKAKLDRWAQVLKTEALPQNIKSPLQAAVMAAHGAELGLSPLRSLSAIHMVKGKPCLKASEIAALIKERFGSDAYTVKRADAEACVIVSRDGLEVSFTQADAKAAGLTGGNWQKYPADMLFARCITRVHKRCYPHLGPVQVLELEQEYERSRKAEPVKTLDDI